MIRKETILFLSFALCVLGDGPYAISEQRIKIEHKEHNGHHGELAHVGSKKPEHHEEYAWSYPSYEYSYSVHDPHTHDKKGQHESREGDEVKGEYWLIEPDGRKRTVTYHADKHSGFNAIVHYSDAHHHIYEHYGKKKEDDKQDEGKSGEEGQGGEEDEDNNAGPEGDAGPTDEEGSEEGRGGQESRSLEGRIVSWGYGPKWNLDSYKGDRYGHDAGRDEERRGRDGGRDMGRDGGRDDERGGRDGGSVQKANDGRNRDEGRKYNIDSLTILENMGSYGRRADDKKKYEGLWRDNKRGGYEGRDEGRDREESLLMEERRKFDERRGYPSHITPYHGYASRINPRFHRHSQGKRG